MKYRFNLIEHPNQGIMELDIYSQNNRFNHLDKISRNILEKSIILAFATVGIIGTLYSFSNRGTSTSTQNFNQFSTSHIGAVSEEVKSKFKDYVAIKGDYKAEKDLDFQMVGDLSDGRYIMEMGDGMRIIITQKEFSYMYADKGSYLLELKRIKKGLVSTVATKKIKIK